jgi:histidinol-phosphate aminotransferase
VSEAIQHEFSNLCRYTGSEYDRLVEAIAAREAVPKDQIILGEILEPLGVHLSLQGGPGGEFVYSDPGYTALIDSAVAVGGRAVGVPLNPRLENDLDALAARVNGRTRAVYLVNPHNPTGIAAVADELKHVARTISRRALVIVDEAYLDFADRFAERTLTDLVRSGENVIVFRTFAKIYGLAGLEIGYGLLPKPISEALNAQGLTNPHLLPRLAVVAAAASTQH